MSVRFTLPALRRLLFIGGCLLLGATARAQSPTVDPTFPPVRVTSNIAAGGIYDVVRQPDGKYVVGGYFQALNGVPASHLARLNADGSVDVAFTAACAADAPVGALALLPDGKLLVGGAFQTLGGGTRNALARLRPDGTLDATFDPNFSRPSSVGNILLLPNGKVLITGDVFPQGPSSSNLRMARLDGATGQTDPSFQFTPPTADSYPTRMVLQADGKVVLSGNVPSYRPAAMLMRVEANGATDSSFPPITSPYTGGVYTLALDGAGRIYAGGSFNSVPGGGMTLRRYLPNGSEDRSFIYNPMGVPMVGAVTIQPNGQLLVGSAATQRLQADGSLDATYTSANGPSGNPNWAFNKVLVEPSGAILVAGMFTLPGTTGSFGLARLNAAGVLAVQSGAAAAQLAAWPVPAHETLNLRLDMAARPQSVQLLDVLGRPVRHVRQPAAELSLPVADLPAGSYQLRVAFADGSQATRRVLLR